ncbi:hypothetical protein ACFVZW_12180 [Streptomyces sp. NPDC059567]|uniref:hypothetical protein n=1 Tax=Streptomyces sp. NPDC059567 TaxID=3346867 RepID=UPI0036CB2863
MGRRKRTEIDVATAANAPPTSRAARKPSVRAAAVADSVRVVATATRTARAEDRAGLPTRVGRPGGESGLFGGGPGRRDRVG